MNRLLICRLLGLIALLIGGSMALSLPWALPLFGQTKHFEAASFFALLGSMATCGLVGGALMYVGRRGKGQTLYRREAIAVVGLSWLLATLLGALPFWLSETCIRIDDEGNRVRMGIADGIFESASGFSGTGATVLTNLEASADPDVPSLVPRAILFWRSQTHFLGGLGIMVLFVAILGMGSAGKALLLTEMPGPSQESAHARTQRAAATFAMIFVLLTAVLTLLLRLQGVSWFDALCHAFGTIATGGFSTHNDSVEHFHSVGVEMTITVFMILACTNFTLLYYLLLRRPGKLLGDLEFRVYLAVMAAVALMVILALRFDGHYDDQGHWTRYSLADSVRYGLFQVASIMTNTGFGTDDFDRWNSFSRGLLVLLMFVGGCAGSTSCSIKVIRHILFFKILWLELEQVFHPSVVRPLRLGDKPLEDPDIRKDVVMYFGVIVLIFVIGWMALIALEPDSTWIEAGQPAGDKLIDCASAVAATLNGVGPGLGIVGEAQNYAHFHWPGKFVLTWMMLLGRLEVFVLLVLFVPRFWRGR
ncbi:MAG: TrkH family potassium uptake protein [Pirellulales bacterium]|nr:TrkH family potassium uptake protein [Pirellulales bacterium]